LPVYVSMLRGINVGPHKRMKMEQLRHSFEALGFEQVATYIQSGNVVFFKAGKSAPSALSKKIEAQLLGDFGFEAPIVSRTAGEISAVVKNNPFIKERGIDPEKLHVMFLSDTPPPAALQKFAELIVPPEQSRCVGREVFLYLPNGVANSKLMKVPLDRVLPVVNTLRNWRTVNQLAQMCEECG